MKLVRAFVVLCLLTVSLRLKGEDKNYPQRILSLSAAATHILTQLGQPPAAIDEYGKIAAGSKIPPVIGKGSALSQEKLVELAIDCVVLWYYQNDVAELSRRKGLRVEKVAAIRLANYPQLVMTLGGLVNRSKKAETLCDNFREKLKKITGGSVEKKPLRVYLELYSKGKSAGDKSYAGDLVRAAGGCCISSKTGLFSTEMVIENAPEVIFYIKGFSKPEEIASRPGFANTPAVKNGKLYPLERRFIVAGLAPLEAIEYLKSCMR